MSIRFLAWCSAALAGILPATAQNIDQVYTKNGSVYEGYISEQIPGKSLSVTTEQATLLVESSDVTSISYATKPVEQLPERLQQWIKTHRDSVRNIEVATVSIKGDRQLRNALVLEQGSRLKLLSCSDDHFALDWNDVVRTTKTPNIEGAKSGIRDIVTMNNGARYEGQIIEQIIPEAEIKVKDLDGNIYTAEMKEVMSIRSERIDFNAPLWEQTPLLDRVESNDGETVEGFIVSRKIGSDITMIVRETGIEKTIPLSGIARYRKSVNHAFVAPEEPGKEEEKKVEKTESTNGVLLNGKEIERLTVIPYSKKFSLVKDPVTASAFVGDTVRIEMPAVAYSALRIVKTTKQEVFTSEKYHLWAGKYPTYTEKAVAASLSNPYVSFDMEKIDEGRRTRLTLLFSEPGIYVILPLDESSKCIALEVKGKKPLHRK